MSTGYKIVQNSNKFPNNVGFNGGGFSSGTVYYSMAGAFTLEAWVNLAGYPTSGNSLLSYNNTFNGLNFYVDSVGLVHFDIPGPWGIIQTTASIPLNTWTHLALTRSASNDCTIFINGVAAATGSTGSRLIGTNGGSDFCTGINGRVSNLRLVAGTNLYPANFTPPVVPLAAVSGTVILLCKATTFIDSGPNNYSFTVSGSPVIYLDASYQVDVDDVLVRREYFSTGSLWYWNNTTMSPVTAAGSGLTWKFLTTGRYGTFGIKSDGTLWDYSTNFAASPSQVSYAGYTNNDWKSFACSYQFPGAQRSFMGIKNDGNIWAWGGNGFGQLGVGDSVNKGSPVTVVGGHTWKSVAMAERSETIGNNLAIRTDGTLWYMNTSPVQVSTGGTWKQISVNSSISGIKTDGTLWSWSGTSSPTTIAGSGGYQWKSVSGGGGNTLAIRLDGTLWGIGSLPFGTYGTLTQFPGGGTNWKTVFGNSGMAIKTDGTLWSWGSTPGDGTSVAKSSPVLVVGGITNWYTGSVGGYEGAAAAITDITI